MLTVRDAIPKPRDLATAGFATLRLRLLTVAARVIETASRVRLAAAGPTRRHPPASSRHGIDVCYAAARIRQQPIRRRLTFSPPPRSRRPSSPAVARAVGDDLVTDREGRGVERRT